MEVVRYYGAKPDSNDPRDQKKAYESVPLRNTDANLSRYVNTVYDQGDLSSCTANAICAAYGIDLEKQSHKEAFDYFPPSRLFLYYNTRARRKQQSRDTGATIRETIKAMKRKGVCSEDDWSYTAENFYEKPNPLCYKAAKGNWVCKYESLHQDRDQLRACLNEECPFVFAFKVCDSFKDMDRRNECIMQMPNEEQDTESCDSHAVVAVAYYDTCSLFKVLNSWGSNWGHRGYFYIPYELIEDPSLCFDFWKISFACQRGAPHPDESSSRSTYSPPPSSSRFNRGASGYGYVPY